MSIDFDLFTRGPLDHGRLAAQFPFLRGARLQQQARDTATFVVAGGGGSVAISFFGALGFGRVDEPVRFEGNGLFAASLLDLAAQKINVIQQRAEAKDYLDIHRLVSEGITLEMALGAGQALYPEFNPAISLKALSYFKDVARLPQNIQLDLSNAASRVRDIPKVPRKSPSLLPNLGAIGRTPEIGDPLPPNRPKTRSDPELEI